MTKKAKAGQHRYKGHRNMGFLLGL